MLNERLFSLYHNHMQALDALYADLDAKCVEDYAGPLLPYCWEELYLRSQHRLVMIGQETNGWYCDYMKSDGEIRKNIEVYKNFQLGAECNSTFWLYAHRFNLELNGFDDLNFIWMNVNKFGRNTGKGKSEQVVLDDEVHYYNLLAEELEILQPDVCLFFTGPNYDEDIRLKISDIEYHEFAQCGATPLEASAEPLLSHISSGLWQPYLRNLYRNIECNSSGLQEVIIDSRKKTSASVSVFGKLALKFYMSKLE